MRIYLAGDILYYSNGRFMGRILPGDDGFYVWWPNPDAGVGYIDGPLLKEIAELLERMNAPWQADIDNYMRNHP
jgi:hypothetical protein